MGAETNVVCILNKEAQNIEEAKEIGNSGNKVGQGASQLAFFCVCPSSVSGRFLVLPTDIQLGDLTVGWSFLETEDNEKFMFLKSLAELAIKVCHLLLLLDEKAFAIVSKKRLRMKLYRQKNLT